MNIKKLSGRNSAMDIIRIVAVFCVISVHFFLHNGFYSEPVQGLPMYIMVLMRTMFTVCVPLFIILTGYLMSKKTLSKSYYKGIVKTLITFVLATIVCMVFKSVYSNEPFTIKTLIFSTLDFTGANYSWYVEMYIGLFLIIPFLNLAYNGLKSKKHKQVLVLTFIVITILPSLFNIFNFDTVSWWASPASSDEFAKLIPSWWIGFYPVTYYFTGCYIREYGFKIPTKSLIVLFIISVILFGSFNFYRSYHTQFKSGSYIYWYGIESYVLSALLFVILSRIKSKSFSATAKLILWKISDLVLGIYLLSYVFDSVIYPQLNSQVTVMTDRLPYYFVTVPAVFILSAFAAAVLLVVEKLIVKTYYFIKSLLIKTYHGLNKFERMDILFVILFAGGIILSIWKCFYGFGGNDEAFYLTVPHRFLMGDAPFRDEWHLSQMSGLLLMPFVWLYTTITGSTEGIILAARFAYIVFHSAVSLAIYIRIRRYGYISLFASVLYLIFTPFNIMALSYNTMGLDFVTLTGVVMGTAGYKKKLPIILSGLAFAAAVLCSPYLLAAYLLYFICMIVHQLIRNKNINFVLKSKLFAPRTFGFFTLGAAILAAVFFIFVFTRESITDIFNNLPYLLTDPEHPQLSILTQFSRYFSSIFNEAENFKFGIIAYLIVLLTMSLDKKRKNHRSIYLIASAGVSIYSLFVFLPDSATSTFNSIMYPMIFTGITSYILCNNKLKNLFAGLFVLGIIYSFALALTSNQYFYVISMASASTNIASFVFLSQIIRELKERPDDVTYPKLSKQISFVFIAFLIGMQSFVQLYSKTNHVFWESGNTSVLTSKIDEGPAKGIYTNANNYNDYSQIYYDLKAFCDGKEKKNTLFLTSRTWCYLAAEDMPYGTLSAWISESIPENINRLKTYYTVNADKTPEYIYIPKNSQWDVTTLYNDASVSGYNVKESEYSYQLEKIN